MNIEAEINAGNTIMQESSMHLSDLAKALHQSIEVEGKCCIKIPVLGV